MACKATFLYCSRCAISETTSPRRVAASLSSHVETHSMKRLKLTKTRREDFLRALADTGSITSAVTAAGTSRTRVYELRKVDPAFAAAWDEAEEIAADRLENEARRRAVEGVSEPLVSAGKLVRDDVGQPVAMRRYSDPLLLALLRMHRPARRERPVRFALPTLRSAADAANAMAGSPSQLLVAKSLRAKPPSCPG
jgi:hypothetical protein